MDVESIFKLFFNLVSDTIILHFPWLLWNKLFDFFDFKITSLKGMIAEAFIPSAHIRLLMLDCIAN